MTKYSLLDANNNILKEIDSVNKPDDPIGKGWKWVENIYNTPPLTEGEEISNIIKTYDEANNVVKVELVKSDIRITRNDINEERIRRLHKKTIIKLAGVGDVTVRLDADYVNSIQSLALSALIKFIRNELDITYTFRDEENVNWSLTPAQVLDLMVAIELEIRDIIEASWLIKDDETPPETFKELKKDPRWP